MAYAKPIHEPTYEELIEKELEDRMTMTDPPIPDPFELDWQQAREKIRRKS